MFSLPGSHPSPSFKSCHSNMIHYYCIIFERVPEFSWRQEEPTRWTVIHELNTFYLVGWLWKIPTRETARLSVQLFCDSKLATTSLSNFIWLSSWQLPSVACAMLTRVACILAQKWCQFLSSHPRKYAPSWEGKLDSTIRFLPSSTRRSYQSGGSDHWNNLREIQFRRGSSIRWLCLWWGSIPSPWARGNYPRF